MAIIVVGGLGSVPGAAVAAMVLGRRAEPAADPDGHDVGADRLLPRAVRARWRSGRRDSSEVVLPSASSGTARSGPPPSARWLAIVAASRRRRAAVPARWRPNPYILSAGIVVAELRGARDLVELRRRLHRLHLARPRGATPGSAATAPAC